MKIVKQFLILFLNIWLVLGYVAFTQFVISSLPFFKWKALDYLAILSILSIYYYTMNEFRVKILKLIESNENKSSN